MPSCANRATAAADLITEAAAVWTPGVEEEEEEEAEEEKEREEDVNPDNHAPLNVGVRANDHLRPCL